MEGYNGYARPLDSLVRSRGYRLYNINNLKLGKSQRVRSCFLYQVESYYDIHVIRRREKERTLLSFEQWG